MPRLLLAIIFLEGYVVLATELLAIRLMLPFAGSGTEIVCIIISAVLMPLALGYHYGARAYGRAFHQARRKGRPIPSVRTLLSRNALSALLILTFGLSYLFLDLMHDLLGAFGVRNRFMFTVLYSALFLVYPVYLLGQTIPLISRLSRHAKLHQAAGRMLFFSTLGSFLGSIVTTLGIMPFLGVHRAATLTCGLIALLAVLPLRRRFDFTYVMAVFFAFLAWQINSNRLFTDLGILSNNNYNTAIVLERSGEQARRLILNKSSSSDIGTGSIDRRYGYAQTFESAFVPPAAAGLPPRKILILGAGGFTVGHGDLHNAYTYVDIDPALKAVAEKHFLKAPLAPNQHFVTQSARSFLNDTKEIYDLILIDTYTNIISVPTETISLEFLRAAKTHLVPQGILAANVIGQPFREDAFSRHYTQTFAAVFPNYWRQVIEPKELWKRGGVERNILFIGSADGAPEDRVLYQDLKNRYLYDR